MQTRRQFIATASAAGAALALGGCGGDDEEAASSGSGGSGAGGERQTGTVDFVTWGGPAELNAFKAIIRDFERQNPGAKVRIRETPFNEVRQTVDASLEAQRGPDMFRVTYNDFGFYASQNTLVDLSEYLPADYGGAFTEGLWQAVQYEGKPYGVPHHTDVSALVYNRDIFRRAGIRTVPDKLEDAYTWEEFLEVARKVRDANPKRGGTAFAMNWQQAGAFRWLNWLYAAGGSLFDEGLTRSTVESPEGKRTLDFFKTWFDEGLAPRNTTPKGTYPDELFPAQTIGMLSAGSFLVPSFEEGVKRFKYGATFLPRDKAAATDLGGNAVVATRVGKKPELCARFLQFLTSEENMRRFCTPTGVLPTRKTLVEQQLRYQVRPDLLPLFVEQATTITPQLTRAVTIPKFTQLNNTFVDQLEALIVRDQSSEDTLRNIGQAANEAVQA